MTQQATGAREHDDSEIIERAVHGLLIGRDEQRGEIALSFVTRLGLARQLAP